MLNYPLHWHPQFIQCPLNELGVLFMGEESDYFLDVDEYYEINSIVNDSGKLSDYVFKEKCRGSQVIRMQRIDQLVENEILMGDKYKCQAFITPDFSLKPRKEVLGKYSVVDLTSHNKNLELIEILEELKFPAGLVLVLVDNYLDPRIAEYNNYFKQSKTDWMLIKTSGKKLLIGPFFSFNRSDFACYHCLYYRFLQNKPVWNWYSRYADIEKSIAVPVQINCSINSEQIKQMENEISASLLRFPDNRDFNTSQYFNSFLYSYEINKSNGEFHQVVKRPQCEYCGDDDLFEKTNAPPMKLVSNVKSDDIDGGYRSASRAYTLEHVQPLISPLSGIISELSSLTEEPHDIKLATDKLTVYRAAYFQNTYSKSVPTKNTFVQLALGKGISREQAQASAVGEALERQSAQFTGEESVKLASCLELDARAITPHQLTSFSPKQYAQFATQSGATMANPQWLKPLDDKTCIHWVKGWSFSKSEIVYFPAAYCYANTPFTDQAYSIYSHNGNSSGNSNEEAILQGALELIERDAAAIWWYNQIPRPGISLDILPKLQQKIISRTLDDEWDFWVLDISHDLQIVCCVAVGQHKKTNKYVLGFGCHLDAAIACQRAITEMYQLITIKNEITGPFDFDAISPHPFLYPKRNSELKTKIDFRPVDTNDIKEDIIYLLEILSLRQLELCVVNNSRSDIFLKTLKVIIPGLCHFWPQFGAERLYEVPVKMGWLTKRLPEIELNSLPLYL